MSEFIIRVKCSGRYYRDYGLGTTPKIEEAFRFSEELLAREFIREWQALEVLPVPSVEGVNARLAELERQNADLQAANSKYLQRIRDITALNQRQSCAVVEAEDWARIMDAARAAAARRAERAEAINRTLYISNENGARAYLDSQAELKALTRTLGGVVRGERIPAGETKFGVEREAA